MRGYASELSCERADDRNLRSEEFILRAADQTLSFTPPLLVPRKGDKEKGLALVIFPMKHSKPIDAVLRRCSALCCLLSA